MANFWEKDPAVNAQETTNFWENDPVAEAEPKKKAENFWEKDKVVSAEPEKKPDEAGIFRRFAETAAVDVPLSGLQGVLETVRGFTAPLREAKEKEQAALAESYKKYGVQPKLTAPSVTDQDLQDAIAKLQSYKSEGTKAAEVKRSEAKGAAETIATYLKNPSLIATGTAEMLAPMIAGGRLGRLFGKVGMPFNYAAGEGVVAGAMNAQQIRDAQGGAPLTPEQQLNVAENIALTTAFSAFGGAVANRLGVGDIDEILAGAAKGELSKKAQSKLAAAAKSAIIEGGIEELPQSVADQIIQNVATNRPWDEGVGEAAASGLVLGSVPGFGAGFYTQAKVNKQLLIDAENKEAEELQTAIDTRKRQGYTDASKEWFNNILKEGRQRRAENEKVAAAAQPIEAAAEAAPEAVAPSEPGVLDANTLKTFQLSPRSNAYRLLLNTDTSTPAGRKLLDDVLEAYSGKVNYDAVNEYLQTVPVEEPVVTEVPEDVETEAIPEVQPDEGAGGVSVQTPFKRGRTRAAQAPEGLELGGVGAVSSDVGQPVGGTGVQPTPLEIAEVNFDTVKAEYDTVLSNPKATPRQIKAVEAKITDAIEQLRAAQIEAETVPAPEIQTQEIQAPEIQAAPEPVIETPVAPEPEVQEAPAIEREAPPGFEWYQETREDGRLEEGLRRVREEPTEVPTEEVVPKEEPVVEEEEEPVAEEAPVETEITEEDLADLDMRKRGKTLAGQLRAFDPYNPLISDLVSEDVTEEAINEAQQVIQEQTAAKAARRPVAPEEEAAALEADQETEAQVDALMGAINRPQATDQEILAESKDTIARGLEQAFGLKASIAPEERVSLDQVMTAVANMMYVYIKQGVKSMGAAISKARKELGPQARRLSREQMVQAYNMAAERVAREKAPKVARAPQGKQQKINAAQKNKRAKELFKKTGLDVPPTRQLTPYQEFIKAPYESIKRGLNSLMTSAFSFDYALNKKMLAAARKQGATPETIRQAFLESQVSQAVATDVQYDSFRTLGGMVYNPSIFKFESYEAEASQLKLETRLNEIAEQYGVDPDEFRKYASAALQARRSKGLIKYNAKLRQTILSLVESNKEAQARKKAKNYKYVNMSPSEIKYGLELFKEYPELYEVVDMWNEVRANVLNFVMQQGIYSKDQIEDLLDVMDYVPFYTVTQVEANADPKQYIRGLLDLSKDKRLKGSTEKVNDIFDNMDRWARHMVKKAIVNRVAQDKIKWYKTFLPDDIKPIADTKQSLKGNYVSIWEDGKLTRYDFQGNDGKTMVQGFTGAEPLILSGSSLLGDFFRSSSNFVRAATVYNPVFSVSQLPMDTWSAMETSGVSNPYGLLRQVIQEIPLTMLNISSARKDLKKVGVVGFHDVFKEYESASIAKEDPSYYNSLKKAAHKLGIPFRLLSTASDNIVRQAVYKQFYKETGDRAMAINAAAEIINFRRSGSSPVLHYIRQMVPFTNANLQAQYVAMGTVLDGGINNNTRAQSFKRVFGIGAKMMPLYLGYVILKSGDDDYEKLSPAERDGFFIINDTYRIPLRMDIFTLMFKVVTEHAYNTVIAKTEDGTKMKEAFKNNLKKALSLPYPVPPVGTSVIENAFNIDLVNNRPLVGKNLEGLEEELQYSSKYTSQLAKVLADGTGLSPIAVDNVLRDVFASVYGISNLVLNKFIAEQMGVVLPEKSTRENIAGWPSMNKFITPEFGARNIEDFYEVLDKVNKVVKSYGELSNISPKRADEYLNRDDNRHVILSKGEVNALAKQLNVLRAYEKKVREEDMGIMSAQGKADELRRIEELRQSMLGHKVGPEEQRYIQNIRFRLGM